jgi:hypothetical protein
MSARHFAAPTLQRRRVTMPDTSALSLSGAKLEAEEAVTALANSVLHLFKFGFVPTPTSLLADFAAQECDFDGYAALTITAWHSPILSGAAYAIYAPTQTFPWTFDTDAVGNAVGGAYLVTAGGVLYQYIQFDPSRPAQGPDQAIVVTPSDVFLAG